MVHKSTNIDSMMCSSPNSILQDSSFSELHQIVGAKYMNHSPSEAVNILWSYRTFVLVVYHSTFMLERPSSAKVRASARHPCKIVTTIFLVYVHSLKYCKRFHVLSPLLSKFSSPMVRKGMNLRTWECLEWIWGKKPDGTVPLNTQQISLMRRMLRIAKVPFKLWM